jgi:hypothetical protein
MGRAIDPRYPTNLAIGLLCATVFLAGVAVQVLTGFDWVPAIQWAIGASFAVFFAWALSRELDPDHDLSAFVGAGLIFVAVWLIELPTLLALLWIILVLRTVNRTTGLAAKVMDSLGLLALGGWLAWQGNWGYGLVTALALGLDGRLSLPLKRHLAFAVLALAITGISLLPFGLFSESKAGVGAAVGVGLSWPVLLALFATSCLFLLVIYGSRVIQSVGDVGGEPLDPRRVQAAQGLALLTALQVAWWQGTPGVTSLLPLWAAMLGTGSYQLFVRFRRVNVLGGRQA